MNFHSRASSRIREPAKALVACVTSENPRSQRLESDRFASGRGAGVVDQLATRNGCVTGNKRVGGILNDEGSLGEARKVFGYRVSAIGYRVKANARAKWCLRRSNAGFAKPLEYQDAIPARGLKCQLGLLVVPLN